MKTEITHDAVRQRYSLVIAGVEAYLTYERPAPGHRHITHTIVPDSLGGQGLGKKLVTRIMDDIIAAGETVSSSCWFATGLIGTRPDWKRHNA
ncbi:MAG: GNAT family N-acetyltransferase [Hyphomonas sp.]